MRYERIERAVFLERPNRFIAYVELNGQKETVHVKNTGRCAELLVPGASVYVQRSANPDRKTKWDLIAVEKGSRMINMDSQIPNRVVQEWIEGGALFENVTQIRPETTWGNSRFDLYVETGEAEDLYRSQGRDAGAGRGVPLPGCAQRPGGEASGGTGPGGERRV